MGSASNSFSILESSHEKMREHRAETESLWITGHSLVCLGNSGSWRLIESAIKSHTALDLRTPPSPFLLLLLLLHQVVSRLKVHPLCPVFLFNPLCHGLSNSLLFHKVLEGLLYSRHPFRRWISLIISFCVLGAQNWNDHNCSCLTPMFCGGFTMSDWLCLPVESHAMM